MVFIANYSGPGSSIIFDYMYTTLLDGTIKRGEVSNMRNKGWVSGERMVFGIPEGQVTEFLEQCGFTNVLDADHMYLHDTDFTGENAKQTVAYPYAIASAVVKPKS